MVDEARLRDVREAKARFGAELLKNPDVHGVGVGRRRRGGKKTEELAIVVHVQRKRPEDKVSPRRLVPKSVRYVNRQREEIDIPVDVVEKPVPVPEVACDDCDANLEARVRPVPGGYSGGPPLSVSNGGTLGGWLWDNVTDQIVVISNDHVLGGTAGTDVTQQSIFDGASSPRDRIANVLRSGTLDVSIAAPVSNDVYELAIECGGPGVFEFAEAQIDMIVQKTGQTTGLTCGIVELVDYDSGHYGSENDLWIDGDGNDFSMGGDSGSLYLERDHPDGQPWRRVVGIHWGGSTNDGVGHPMPAVVEDLDLTTVCDGALRSLIDAIFGRAGDDGAEMEAERSAMLAGWSPPDRWRPPTPRYLFDRWPLRRQRRKGRRSFARAAETRLRETRHGADLVDLIHQHRVAAVRLALNTDGRRALHAALGPIAKRVVTTDDLLAYRLDDEDIANVERLLVVAERMGGDAMAEAIEHVRQLVGRGSGRALKDMLK
ncbi:MAG: hypothetical protein QNL12_12080 [Acidimicrobiia bacterium]|nr:hypothetical protein [Acidimicrobiia bacterium]